MNNEMDDWGMVAFTFVLGYAERALHNEGKLYVRPDGTTQKPEIVKRLETTIEMLNRFLDWWTGNV